MNTRYKKRGLVILTGALFPCSFLLHATPFVQNGGNTTWGNISALDSYDSIQINASANASGAPLSGFGLYNVTGDVLNAPITITTQGLYADGLRQNNAQTQNSTQTPYGVLNIGDNLSISTTGLSADGINMSITNSSIVNIGNNATITTEDGVGIRVNLSRISNAVNNTVNVGDNLTIITHGDGDNIGVDGPTEGPNNLGGNDKVSGYAIYVGARDYETETQGTGLNTAYATIGNNSTLTTSGNAAHAVYANKTGTVSLGSTNITTTGNAAHGLYAQDGFVTNVDRTGFAPIAGQTVNYSGGIINLLGDTKIAVNTANDGTSQQSYAMYSSGDGSVISSSNANNTLNTNIYTITGDMKADNAGKIDLTMNNGSLFNGNTSIDNTGELNLKITGANSQWNITKSSELSALELTNSVVSLGNQATQLNSGNSVTLTMKELKGNGTFNMRTTVDGVNNFHDLLQVTQANGASGNHTLLINDSQTGGTTVTGVERVQLVKTEGGSAAFTGTTDIGGYTYNVTKGDTAQGERDSDWYLASNGQGGGAGGGGSGPVVSNAGDSSANTLNINYLMNYVENQTIMQRMGELRSPSNQGGNAWARVYNGYINSFNSHNLRDSKLRYTGVQFGIDKNIDATGSKDLYVGLVGGMSKGKTGFNVGNGNTRSYYAGIYGTYKEDNGFYVDFIAKYMLMNNKFNTKTSGGYAVNGNGYTRGYALSLETGKRFWLGEKPSATQGSWFIEPQGQITYSHQGDTTIHSSNGLSTKLDDFDSILGRAGSLFGYSTYAGNANKVDVYLKAGYVKEFDGNTSYRFNKGRKESYSFKGHWFDTGIGVNAQISGQHNVYADFDYATGNRFDQRQVNVGYRYNF